MPHSDLVFKQKAIHIQLPQDKLIYLHLQLFPPTLRAMRIYHLMDTYCYVTVRHSTKARGRIPLWDVGAGLSDETDFVCLFTATRANFQLSGGCHHYRWQGCKFRPMLALRAFEQGGVSPTATRDLRLYGLIRKTGTHVPQWDSNPRRKDHQIFGSDGITTAPRRRLSEFETWRVQKVAGDSKYAELLASDRKHLNV
jgi:hypothetical protein